MDIFEKTWHDLNEFGIAGSEIFINSNGDVEVRSLTIDECYDLIEKNNNGVAFPEGITIANENGIITPPINNNK